MDPRSLWGAVELLPYQKIATTAATSCDDGSGEDPRGASSQQQSLRAAFPSLFAPTAGDAEWIATEKIHGAQVQIYCVREVAGPVAGAPAQYSVRCAKRTGWLKPHESFFGYQEVLARVRPDVVSLHDLLVKATTPAGGEGASTTSVLVLYGELFGGWYPDSASAPPPTAAPKDAVQRPVQEGVWYSHRREFAAFDAAFNPRSLATQDAAILPWLTMERMAAAAGVVVVPKLGAGSFQCADAVPPIFPTTVPAALTARYGRGSSPSDAPTASCDTPFVPPVPLPAGNWAEGVVVRPNDPRPTAVNKGMAVRPLYKNKHPNFSEVEGIATDATAADDPPALRVKRVLLGMATRNRCVAVVSKHGWDGGLSEEDLALEVLADVMEDFWMATSKQAVEFHALYAALRPEDTAHIDAAITAAALHLLKALPK